jgi:glycosyltransferase involved in cell wall biosynthesis
MPTQLTNNNSQLTGNGVSIIILTKDAPQHLDNLLSSFFATNTYKPVEVLVIDHACPVKPGSPQGCFTGGDASNTKTTEKKQITNNNSQLTEISQLTVKDSSLITNNDLPREITPKEFPKEFHRGEQLTVKDSSQITNNHSQLTEISQLTVKDSCLITINHSQLTTNEVVSKYVALAFIRHIKRGKNYSFSNSCNFGAARARHPYLLFLNDDIVYTSDILPAAVARLEEDENLKYLSMGNHTIYRKQSPEHKLPSHKDQTAGEPFSIALFWKQNDTTIYGRRHDMIIKYLASRPDIDKVIVFDAPVSNKTIEKLAADRGLTQNSLVYDRIRQKVLGLLDTSKVSYRVFINESHKRYLDFIEENIDHHTNTFWFYPRIKDASAIIEHFTPDCVVADIVDDHRAWPDITQEMKQNASENYSAVLSRTNYCLCNCRPVMESMIEFFRDIRLVPNACDPTPLALPVYNNDLYDRLRQKKRPVIGFSGNLEKKIDTLLLEKTAASFPESDLVLIGSTHANPEILNLDRFSNVHFTGVVPYEQTGTWMSLFDVALIPHLDMKLTRNMNPLKLYHYLAWDIPVVSTEVHNIDASSGMVFMCKSHDEFLGKIRDILDKKVHLPDISQWRRDNSWAARLEPHVDEIVGFAKSKRVAVNGYDGLEPDNK